MTIDVAKSVKKMFVDGQWVESESGAALRRRQPRDRRGHRPGAEGHARRRAASGRGRSQGPQERWPASRAFERSKRLHRIAEAIEKRREELGHLLTLDQGKPLVAEALGEVDEAAEYFRIAAEDLKRLEGRVLPSASPSKLVFARHYPRGVYGMITPWNWPLTMAAELIAPALAAGNTVVWTPATSTSVDLGRADGVHRRGRPPGRRHQPRHRPGRRGRRRGRRPPAGRWRRFRRLDRDRTPRWRAARRAST